MLGAQEGAREKAELVSYEAATEAIIETAGCPSHSGVPGR